MHTGSPFTHSLARSNLFLFVFFFQHGAVSSVDLNTHAKAVPDATAGNEFKPSAQALVQMGADGRIGATEAAVHALVMTHNLTLHGRRLCVSFLNSERHPGK